MEQYTPLMEADVVFLYGVKEVFYTTVMKGEEHLLKELQTKYRIFKYDADNYYYVFVFKTVEGYELFLREQVQYFTDEYVKENHADHNIRLGALLGYPPAATKKFAEDVHNLIDSRTSISVEYCGIQFRSFRETLLEDVDWLLRNKPVEEFYLTVKFDVRDKKGVTFYNTTLSFYNHHSIMMIFEVIQSALNSSKLPKHGNPCKTNLARMIGKLFSTGVKDVYYVSVPRNKYYKVMDVKELFDVEVFETENAYRMFVFKDEVARSKYENCEVLIKETGTSKRSKEWHKNLGLLLGFPPKAVDKFAYGDHDKFDEEPHVTINYCGIQFRSFIDTVESDVEFLLQKRPEDPKNFNLNIQIQLKSVDGVKMEFNADDDISKILVQIERAKIVIYNQLNS